jgi:uncharacterized membrane protein
LDDYGVEYYQHNRSTWMVMALNVIGITNQPLTVFGITIQLELDGYGIECHRHNHSTWMIMVLNVIGITNQPLTVFSSA